MTFIDMWHEATMRAFVCDTLAAPKATEVQSPKDTVSSTVPSDDYKDKERINLDDSDIEAIKKIISESIENQTPEMIETSEKEDNYYLHASQIKQKKKADVSSTSSVGDVIPDRYSDVNGKHFLAFQTTSNHVKEVKQIEDENESLKSNYSL